MAARGIPSEAVGAAGGGIDGSGGEGEGGTNGGGVSGGGGGGLDGGGGEGGGGEGGEGGGAEGGALFLVTATLTSDADMVTACPVAAVMAALIALKSMEVEMVSRPDVELAKSENV